MTVNTRSAPASAEKMLDICMEILLMGKENWREALQNAVSPPTSKPVVRHRMPPTPAVMA